MTLYATATNSLCKFLVNTSVINNSRKKLKHSSLYHKIRAVTFKDLKKRVSTETTTQLQQSKLSGRLKNKPFWIWDIEEHRQEDTRTNGDCCFNHIIGLPQKDGIDKPLYDYEEIIFDSLITPSGSANNKHLWIKKATGLGISEFMLRFMAWLCLKDNALSGSQMCIVTGPRIDLAIAPIDRMKRLFAGKGLISILDRSICSMTKGIVLKCKNGTFA
jgi:hypothetical protein